MFCCHLTLHRIPQRHNANGIVKEILDDLDNALDCDEHKHTSCNEIQQNSQVLSFLHFEIFEYNRFFLPQFQVAANQLMLLISINYV